MLKNNVLLCIIVIFLILTLFLGRWIFNNRRDLALCEILNEDVETGILSTTNLSSTLNGMMFEVESAGVFNSDLAEIKKPESFDNAILLYINSEMCEPCVQYALGVLKDIQIDSAEIRFFLYGGMSNLRDLYVLVRNSGLTYYGIFTSYESPFSDLRIEQLPIILIVGQNNLIERSCYVDSRMPISFYSSFIGK